MKEVIINPQTSLWKVFGGITHLKEKERYSVKPATVSSVRSVDYAQ